MRTVIDDLFNFSFKSPGKENPLAAIQKEGVYRLWNCLEDKNIALLADEVGLGKTFQALALCALTWIQNPHARILVIAPNRSILGHWEKEYEIFCNSVYKPNDDIITTVLTHEIVNSSRIVTNLKKLVGYVENESDHLFLLSMHAFSMITGVKEGDNLSPENFREKGEEYRNQILEVISSGFDLLIIDEAHYFRNIDGDSNRVNTAQGFFSGLAQKVLLMTATPNHTQETDIKNIFTYFTYLTKNRDNNKQKEDDILDKDTILNNYTIRRLKQLEIDGKTVNKYAYRQEEADESHFDAEKKQQELFFALYQRQLARLTNHKGGATKQFQLGYLEGLESTTISKDSSTENNTSTDYSTAADSKILQRMVSLFDGNVQHPKMDKLVDALVEDSYKLCNPEDREKGLVFVRRIPSVREITRRANRKMDEHFIELMQTIWDIDEKLKKSLKSDDLDEALQHYRIGKAVEEDNDYLSEETTSGEDAQSGSQETYSEVFRMFIENRMLEKEGLKKTTEAFRYLQRMTSNTSILSILFEPALDYRSGKYVFSTLFVNKSEKQEKLYLDSVRSERKNNLIDTKELDQVNIIDQLFSSNKKEATVDSSHDIKRDDYPTIWSILYDKLPNYERNMYDSFSLEEKEAIARFYRKGILYASPVRVLLFTCFMKNYAKKVKGNNTEGIHNLYSSLINDIEDNYEHLKDHLLWYLNQSIVQFQNYYKHVSPTNKTESLITRNWPEFNNTNPAEFCSGSVKDSRRASIINAFNSPFYPDILVTTSVLQEGVSLHLNCRKVYHYGIPDNCGSWEQRVGRLDRNDSLIHKLYPISDKRLEIRYPYLQKTYDEDQLKFFIKRNNEARKLLDFCGLAEFSNVMDEFDPSLKVSDCIRTYDEYQNNGTIFSLDTSVEKKLDYQKSTAPDDQVKIVRETISTVLGIDRNFVANSPWKDMHVSLDKLEFDDQEDSRVLNIALSYIPRISGLESGCYYCLSLSLAIGDTLEESFFDINHDNSTDEKDLYDFFYRTLNTDHKTVHTMFPAVQLCMDPEMGNQMKAKYLLRVDILVNLTSNHLKTMLESGKEQLFGCYKLFRDTKVETTKQASYSLHLPETGGPVSLKEAMRILEWNYKYPFLRFSYDGTSCDLSKLTITHETYNHSETYRRLLDKWEAVVRREIQESLEQKKPNIVNDQSAVPEQETI